MNKLFSKYKPTHVVHLAAQVKFRKLTRVFITMRMMTNDNDDYDDDRLAVSTTTYGPTVTSSSTT